MEKRISITLGFLIGGMWFGEIFVGNLAGTTVLGNLGEYHPGIYAIAAWFAVGAVIVTLMGGMFAAYRTGSIAAALRVGAWSGLISGGIVFVTVVTLVLLFHGAMMKDPSNIHEFAKTAHRVPTEAELSSFLFWDALGGGANHIWIGPLLGVTAGGIGAVFGKFQFLSERPSTSPTR
jgi:hypothetical protein